MTTAAERLLSRFAEPGRAAAPSGDRPTEADFRASLPVPVRVASNELTEHTDLKRIVAGMKREMRAYLAGGGTAEQYLAELERRQRLEISYRENAEKRLKELLDVRDKRGPSQDGGDEARLSFKEAYDYWLKANASLKSMGIYEMPLPDALRDHAAKLNLDE